MYFCQVYNHLKLKARKQQYGCGVYEVGDTEKCYVQLFVTDSGRVIPISGRVLTEDDLMQAYIWGRLDAEGRDDVLDEHSEAGKESGEQSNGD